MVATIKNQSEYRGRLWRIYEEISSFKNKYPGFKVDKIGRNSNTVAYHLACLARTQGINETWSGCVPECVYKLLVNDSVNADVMN
jgi:hypothetical protein